MKVVIINKSDSTGGAAVVSMRLLQALVEEGVDARMLVAEKVTDSDRVQPAAGRMQLRGAFLRERMGIYLANGMDRDTLFRIDNGACGVPVYRHKWVREADVICLNWVNQGLVSLQGVSRLLDLGKPLVWTMHDMWNMTGVCHHAGECDRWKEHCGECPLLGVRACSDDMSHQTWLRKDNLYNFGHRRIHFVAVSNWLADLARKSSLMGNQEISVIPNAFPFDGLRPTFIDGLRDGRCRILFGAARLDDPVKGLPLLKRGLEQLVKRHKDVAGRCELITFGGVKDPGSIEGFAIPHTHLGVLDSDKVKQLYQTGDIVVSSSLYETLPGTLVEGQAWGCVPVATDRGGQSDIVDHRQTGYLVHYDGEEKTARDMADGIAWAFCEIERNGAALRHAMHASARERFAARVVAEKYMDLFRSMLA